MRENSMTGIIYDYFASRILFGYYARGDRLPSISYICDQFQVSVMTVRAALSRLQEESYIETAERKPATVIYVPGEWAERQYIDSFLSRKEGMDDICQSAGILFDPIARFYFQRQNDTSVKRILRQLKKADGHAAKQITMFYAEAMRPLNNPLTLNLYWEVVRYLRMPYLERPASFGETETHAAGHIRRMLSLMQKGAPDKAVAEMRAFNEDVMRSFLHRMHNAFDGRRAVEQVPFAWQIYRERPQLCYTLAADMMCKIDGNPYRQGAFLPSCQSLALEYGVSPITMRRTLELLSDMRITETRNGIGTRVIAGKNAAAPDFTRPQIRKNLRLFLQALQIGALTCRDVTAHTLSSLDERGLRTLDERIQNHRDARTVYLLGEACFRFIGENSPSAFLAEVYRQLYRLLLWGHALHIFFQQSQSASVYTAYASGLQEKLRRQDIHGFSVLFSEFMASVLEVARGLLLELGINESKLL